MYCLCFLLWCVPNLLVHTGGCLAIVFRHSSNGELAKTASTGGRDEEELNAAVRQIVSRAVASDRVIDIFSAAGLKSPEISILSDQFLAEVKGLPQRNLAFEALKKF